MNWIKVIIAIFALLETSNIVVLYFFPGAKQANGMGAFKAWEKAINHPELKDLTSYLVNWVAGTKLIFIGLLVVILFTSDNSALILAAGVMALTISSFYWRLFPLVRKMDNEGKIEPQGYSKTLGWMIGAMVLCFLVAALIEFL